MTALGVEAQIQEALFTRLAALVLAPTLQVAYPDVKFPASGNKPDNYLEAAILRAQTVPIGLSAWDEHAGIFQVTVVTKQFQALGSQIPTQIADAVAAWFPRNWSDPSGLVRVYETPAIASPIADAPYTRTPVSIRYRTFIR